MRKANRWLARKIRQERVDYFLLFVTCLPRSIVYQIVVMWLRVRVCLLLLLYLSVFLVGCFGNACAYTAWMRDKHVYVCLVDGGWFGGGVSCWCCNRLVLRAIKRHSKCVLLCVFFVDPVGKRLKCLSRWYKLSLKCGFAYWGLYDGCVRVESWVGRLPR